MKSVMSELAQAKRHFSSLPLFDYLRNDAIAPRDRLAFVPYLAPYLQARADLVQAMVGEQPAGDPCQDLVNQRARDEEHRLSWYLEDLRKLGFDNTTSVTQSLRVLEAIALAPLERMRCLDLAFRVFDMLTDASAELLALARHALAQRTMPRLVLTAGRAQP